MGELKVALVTLVCVLIGATMLASVARSATYSNPAPLGPTDNAPLLPYPSPIAVGGEQGTTVNVSAT